MIALTWDRTWDLYIWALFTSPSGMNSALKIRRRKQFSQSFELNFVIVFRRVLFLVAIRFLLVLQSIL